jgi:hypothetical protein
MVAPRPQDFLTCCLAPLLLLLCPQGGVLALRTMRRLKRDPAWPLPTHDLR